MKDYLKELKQFLKLGIPIYGSQASYAAMGLTDTITKADTNYNPPSTLASPNSGGQGQSWALMATWDNLG